MLDDELAPREKLSPTEDVIVRIQGKIFRCPCGCNVFRHPDGLPNIYRCNSCGNEYEGG
jgi:hypothetical protein